MHITKYSIYLYKSNLYQSIYLYKSNIYTHTYTHTFVCMCMCMCVMCVRIPAPRALPSAPCVTPDLACSTAR